MVPGSWWPTQLCAWQVSEAFAAVGVDIYSMYKDQSSTSRILNMYLQLSAYRVLYMCSSDIHI